MIIDIYHNILWSKYKGRVFSSLYALANKQKDEVNITQIAATSSERVGLSTLDTSYHHYPYQLMFDSVYDTIPKWQLYKSLFLSVWNSRADLIILPGYHQVEYWVMLLACMLKRTPRAVFVDSTRYDNPISWVKDVLKRVFFFCCDGFFCYGTRSKEYLMGLGVPERKINIRCQAAALPHGYNSADALTRRLSADYRSATPSFLYVGRLSQEKSLDILLMAFQKLLSDGVNANLVLVGNGPLLADLQAQARQLGIENSVNFAGSADLEKLTNYYLAATCLVLPSRSEPWGLVVNEALSYGCPAIVSNNCGCVVDLISDGETGYKFVTDDVSDLKEKMEQALSTLVDRKQTAEKCIEMISKFTPDVAAQQILDGCKRLISKSGD
ncbi:glycosyltransferase [Acinetobacter parvus]|uniref:glycosyltransferase n=1 Tax=Acinetobacter parvus TaxID=134533 RepID=UPI003919DF74